MASGDEGSEEKKDVKAPASVVSGPMSADAPIFQPTPESKAKSDMASIIEKLPAGHRLLLRGQFMDHAGNWCKYYLGTLKSFNNKNGYGFVDCPTASQDWGADVFIHKQLVPNPWVLGQPVEFAVTLNGRGQPQATDVQWLRWLPDRNGPQQNRPKPQQNRNHAGGGGGGYSGPAGGGGGYSGPTGGGGGAGKGSSPMAASGGGGGSAPPGGGPRFRLLGSLKSYSAAQGYGFIASEYAMEKYMRDVYFDRSQLPGHGGWRNGQALDFELSFNNKGNPQARNINWDPVPMSPSSEGGPMGLAGKAPEVSPETLSRLQNLVVLLHENKAEAALVKAIDYRGPKMDAAVMDYDADDVIFVLDRLESPEVVSTFKNFVRLLLMLMLAKMFKRYTAPSRCKQLAQWLDTVARIIDPKSEDIRTHYPDVVQRIIKILSEAKVMNPAFFEADGVAVIVEGIEGIFMSRFNATQ